MIDDYRVVIEIETLIGECYKESFLNLLLKNLSTFPMSYKDNEQTVSYKRCLLNVGCGDECSGLIYIDPLNNISLQISKRKHQEIVGEISLLSSIYDKKEYLQKFFINHLWYLIQEGNEFMQEDIEIMEKMYKYEISEDSFVLYNFKCDFGEASINICIV